MTPIELSRSLMGKVSIEERYFRVLVSYLIRGGKMRLFYREHTWAKYLKDMGEDEGTDMYTFLMTRRNEYMMNVEDLIIGDLSNLKN